MTSQSNPDSKEVTVEFMKANAIAMKYLEGQELTVAELDAAIRKATIAVKMIPVLAGTALRNKGIHPLLDAVIDYLPSPADVPPVTGVDPRNTTEKLQRASIGLTNCGSSGIKRNPSKADALPYIMWRGDRFQKPLCDFALTSP